MKTSRNHSFLTGDRIIQIIQEIDLHPLSIQREAFEEAGSAEASFAVGYYEIGEFFTCVEFDRQPG